MAKKRIQDQPYEYEKLSQATTQLRQVFFVSVCVCADCRKATVVMNLSGLALLEGFAPMTPADCDAACLLKGDNACLKGLMCDCLQVEREIDGKEWTTKMVSELSKTLGKAPTSWKCCQHEKKQVHGSLRTCFSHRNQTILTICPPSSKLLHFIFRFEENSKV